MKADNKHSGYDLVQMQFMSLDAKIRMSEQRIKQWYEAWDGRVFVSFSGGKDSTALLHLVRNLYPDVEAIYVDTGLEYPEVRDHVRSVENVTWLKPKMGFKEVIKKYGYPVISKEVSGAIYESRLPNDTPTKRKRLNQLNGTDEKGYNFAKYGFMKDAPFNVLGKCCSVMKKSPVYSFERKSKKYSYVGTMACESVLRKQSWVKNGCNAFAMTHPQSRPLSFWTEQDILEYIQRFNLTIPSVYGEIIEAGNEVERMDGMHKELKTSGCDRTGCMFCMFGCHLNNDERFTRLKQTHPRVYDYCMRSTEEGGLGMKEVIDWMNEHGSLNIKY